MPITLDDEKISSAVNSIIEYLAIDGVIVDARMAAFIASRLRDLVMLATIDCNIRRLEAALTDAQKPIN